MEKDTTTLLITTLEKVIDEVKNLETSNETLTEELGKLRYENINLKKQIDDLKKEIERWKSIAIGQK